MTERPLNKRREGIFGIAILLSGVVITALCLMRFVLDSTPQSLFPTQQQEKFFFDLFGIICGCWLLSWVSAVNSWKGVAKIGQWLGIILLCVNQAILLGVLREISAMTASPGKWLAPGLVQTYMIGCFFGFFTLPALTSSGNRTLTGLGTLMLLLPWLLGKDTVMAGTEYLHGLFF